MNTGLKNLAFVCALAALATAACGGDGSLSVTGPSSPGGATAGAGATITGRVNSGSGLASTINGSTGGGLTVTIVGTNVSAPVDASGGFTLTNVPEGTVRLEFSGPGVNASVTITVSTGEQIQIAVTVNGSSAQVESQHRSGRNRAEVEGRITELVAANRTLRVSGTLVTVPETAEIRRGGQRLQFADLVVGDKVEVRGAIEGTTFVASEVRVEGDNRGRDLQQRRGTVAELAGTCPELTFTLGTLRITTNGSTFFKDVSCANVQNGVPVEVNGRPQQDGSLLAVIVKDRRDEDDDDDDDDGDDNDDDEARIEGMVSALSGTCPAITFTASNTTVTTTSATRFDDGCAAVQNGSRVEVRGTRQATSSILATRVKLED
jgi:hypothetical protein